MSLENEIAELSKAFKTEITELTKAVKDLSGQVRFILANPAIDGLRLPPIEKMGLSVSEKIPAKVTAAKPEPVKAKAKTIEAEQKEDMDAILEEALEAGEEVEEDAFALPPGKHDEAYIRLHIMPKLLDLAKISSPEFVKEQISKFKTIAGAKVTKSTELQSKDLAKVLGMVRDETARIKAEEV